MKKKRAKKSDLINLIYQCIFRDFGIEIEVKDKDVGYINERYNRL